MKFAAWNPLRPKNFVLVALALGILAGIWLSDLFKGFGLGPETAQTKSPGDSSAPPDAQSNVDDVDDVDSQADLVGYHAADAASDSVAAAPSPLVKVLIDDRQYFLRGDDGKQPISLNDLVEHIGKAKPNEDGLRAVVERTSDSRVSAEKQLFEALKAAGVPQDAVYMPKQPVE